MGTKQYPVDDWEKQVFIKKIPIRDVAESAGVTPKVIRYHLNRVNHASVRKRRQRGIPSSHVLSGAQVLLARVKRETGMSWKALGEEFGMSENRILGILRYQCIKRGWDWPIKVEKTRR